MTHPDDNGRDDPGQSRRDSAGGTSPGASSEPGLPPDEDAAWREIIAHYGERVQLTTTDPEATGSTGSTGPTGATEPAATPDTAARPSPFDRAYLDALESARAPEPSLDSWADEGHFVPPEPPPVPRGTPARRLAWAGLFGAPAVMLAAVVLGWTFATWLVVVLVAAFVGGFVFLVATMQRDHDDWSGDDGAVI